MRPDGFSLPHQHTLIHYCSHTENFGAPNRLCSSITKLKHITAVKKPWCRSSWYNTLQQMLVANTQNNQLTAARADFVSRGRLEGTCLGEVLHLLSNNQDDIDNEASEDTSPNLNGEDLDLNLDGQSNHGMDDSSGPHDGPLILGEVMLAMKKGTSICNYFNS